MSLLTFETLKDQGVSNLLMKLLLFGDSGAGKTHTAVTAPKPCVLLTEPNGILSIHSSNPDAVVIDVTKIAAEKDVSPMTVVREFFKAALDGTFQNDLQIETVIIDSLTELQRMLKDEILDQKRGNGSAVVQWTLQDWSTLTDRMRKLIRSIRDLPFNVVCTALAEVNIDEQERRHVVPSFEGKKFANEIAGYFSLVGYVFKQSEEQEGEGQQSILRHRVLLNGPSTYLTKSISPLNSVEEPNIADWLVRIKGHNSGASQPAEVATMGQGKTAKRTTSRRQRASATSAK